MGHYNDGDIECNDNNNDDNDKNDNNSDDSDDDDDADDKSVVACHWNGRTLRMHFWRGAVLAVQ